MPLKSRSETLPLEPTSLGFFFSLQLSSSVCEPKQTLLGNAKIFIFRTDMLFEQVTLRTEID